jgi:hypothetical protein
VFAVIRESYADGEKWTFSGITGVYVTLDRAEEVAGSSLQNMLENGFTRNEVKFTVRPTTFYDE